WTEHQPLADARAAASTPMPPPRATAGTPMPAPEVRTAATSLTRVPHLVSAVTVLLVAWTALWVGETLAVSLERRFVPALAPKQFHHKDRGPALQRAAFAQPDRLPLYGSSELQTLGSRHHASNLFMEYPTGFTVFPVGDIGTTALIMVQSLASVGGDARGRKVVFLLSPNWYYQVKDYSEEYAGNFSGLQA